MERDSFIRLYFKNEVQTLKEKADYIVEKHQKLSSILNKTDWYFTKKNDINIQDTKLVSRHILNEFKKDIRRITILSKIPDDYIEEDSNGIIFFSSNKTGFSNFDYTIYTKDLSKYNSCIFVCKFNEITQMQEFESAKLFVKNLIEIFPTFTLEVIDRSIYTYNEKLNNECWPGWMMYFDSSFELPALPEWVKVEKLSTGGHLIITTEEVFNPENPEHVKKAKDLLPLLQLKPSVTNL